MARGRGKAGGKLVRAALTYLAKPKVRKSRALRMPRRPFRQPGNVNGDWRLGPKRIAHKRVSRLMGNYKPYGGADPDDFLKEHWDPAARGGKGGWKYPEHEGYATRTNAAGDTEPIKSTVTLKPGERLDRFGSESGNYLSPDGTPFEQRALPPSNLGQADGVKGPHGYHQYEVLKPFNVESGPIAPAFSQPGGGIQHVVRGDMIDDAKGADVDVAWLVDKKFLRYIPPGLP